MNKDIEMLEKINNTQAKIISEYYEEIEKLRKAYNNLIDDYETLLLKNRELKDKIEMIEDLIIEE